MITLDDFTLLSIGSRNNFEGTVARCPVCGRNGVVLHPDERAGLLRPRRGVGNPLRRHAHRFDRPLPDSGIALLP